MMALVPYKENAVSALSKLHNSSARLHFANRDINLVQDWNKLGVAAVVWDAAIVMCMYLELGKVELKGKRVIELGAGTGLVGIVATLLGAQVSITDREPALNFLSSNVKSNLPPDLLDSATVSELTWGENLNHFPVGGFDVILGADIVYLEDTFAALLQTLEHLCHRSSIVLLSCKLRYARDATFLRMLSDRFIVEEVLYDRERDIHLYKAIKLQPNRDL